MLKETGRGKSQWKVQDLPGDGRCIQAVLDFLSAMDVGRLVPTGEETGSEVSGWELREREEQPLFLHTLSFMASAGEC